MPNNQSNNSDEQSTSHTIKEYKLEIHRTLKDSPNNKNLINHLAQKINLTKKDDKKHISMVVANLWHHYQCRTYWTSYSRNNSVLYKHNRYNELSITQHYILKVVDALFENGYIEKYPHTFKCVGHENNRISAMRATPILISLINAPNQNVELSSVEEVLILRDENKIDIEYVDSLRTNTMRNSIKKYNSLLEKTQITFDFDKVVIPHNINLSDKKIRRIFSNSSWSEGGRFYGGFWQPTPKALRKHLLINHKPTVELDYQAFHVRLLYAKEKALFPRDQDPYCLQKFITKANDKIKNKQIRNFLKKVLIISFNVSSPQSLPSVLEKEIMEDIKDKKVSYPPIEDRPPINEVVKLFKKLHAPIAKYIGSKNGRKIQYLDSQIAEYIIKAMTKLEYPVLTIHDSFICMDIHEQTLATLMKEGFLHIFKDFPGVDHPVISWPTFRSITCNVEPHYIDDDHAPSTSSSSWINLDFLKSD